MHAAPSMDKDDMLYGWARRAVDEDRQGDTPRASLNRARRLVELAEATHVLDPLGAAETLADAEWAYRIAASDKR